jgi:hypothetical protein
VSAVPYRYRFDQKEVIAERPGGLVVVAVLLLVTTVLAFPVGMFLLQAFLVDPYQNTWRPLNLVSATTVLTLLAWSVASFVAAGGLLAGQRWAYLLTNLVCMAGYGVMTASYGIVTLTNPGRDIGILFMAISIVIIIALGSPYWLAQAYLLRRGTRGWFRLAERLRGEHRRDATAS